MSAPKKQKIHNGKKEDTGEEQTIHLAQQVGLQVGLVGLEVGQQVGQQVGLQVGLQVGQQVERSVRELLVKQGVELLQTKQALEQKQRALYEAMSIVNNDIDTQFHWGKLSLDIRSDPNCVLQALHENSHLKLSDIPKDLLLSNRQVALEACKAGIYEDFRPEPEEWQNNKALSGVALAQGLVQSMAQVPALTTEDVVDLLKNQKIRWRKVPEELKADENFCRRVVAFDGSSRYSALSLAVRVFRRWRHLSQDRQIWEGIFASPCSFSPAGTDLTALLRSEAPRIFLRDVTFMQQAYDKDPHTLEVAHPFALEQFIKDKIVENPKILAFCPQVFPGQFPEFVKAQLAAFSNTLDKTDVYSARILSDKIPGHLFEDEHFTVLWFQEAGLPLTRSHPETLKANRDIFLLAAEHGRHLKWKLDSLRNAKTDLLDDDSFIADVMNHEPILFEMASERIRNNNFELAMVALSQPLFVTRCRGAIAAYARDRRNAPRPRLSEETLEALFHRAESDILLDHKFVNLFLGGLHFAGRHTMLLQQTMSELNPGIKRHIGEYLGYPQSGVLRKNMKAAITNLENSIQQGNIE